jgi:hypothetical protein
MMVFALLLGSVASRPLIPDSTPLTHAPFILTHDAGSGYLPGGLVNGWTKTQSQGLAGQLECGARAFDARPLNDPDKGLIWHHGGVAVDYSFNQSIADIKAWCARNPDELVLMTVWDCEGKGCMEAVGAVAIAQNVSNVQDCRAIQTTYGQAKAMGKLRTGGSFLIITGPPTANAVACAITKYDSSLACNCRCWATDAAHEQEMEKIKTYLDGFTALGLSETAFMQAQTLWQESAESVTCGTLRNSSLVTDERKSGLNRFLADQVRAGRWAKQLNLLEVNDVCDPDGSGNDLLAALREKL